MAHDLAALGINVDCVPVLDVPDPGGHEIIGDRAYGQTPDEVALLGRAAAEGLIAGGVLPVIKHIPGHGRAMADSHLELPVVDARLRRARRPRLRAVPGALRHADGDDRPRDLLGDRPRSARPPPRKKVMRRGDPRRDRLRRPGDERRPVDEGAERRLHRARRGVAGRRLRRGPALQRRHGRDEGGGRRRRAAEGPGRGAAPTPRWPASPGRPSRSTRPRPAPASTRPSTGGGRHERRLPAHPRLRRRVLPYYFSERLRLCFFPTVLAANVVPIVS